MKHELTGDVPVGHRWVGIDSRQVLPAAHVAKVAELREMVRELGLLADRLPGVLALMRADQAGHPRAAAADVSGAGDGLRRYWCFEHERSLRECFDAGCLCTGELSVMADSVGEEAIGPDMAARDMKALLAELDRLLPIGHRMLGLAAAYPTTAAMREQLGPDPEVGTLWCRSCWRNDRRCVEIHRRRSTGEPYYVGLCRWCGLTRSAIGGSKLKANDHRGDPPLWLVVKHHQGEPITPGDLDAARDQVPRPPAKSPSKKGKKRK